MKVGELYDYIMSIYELYDDIKVVDNMDIEISNCVLSDTKVEDNESVIQSLIIVENKPKFIHLINSEIQEITIHNDKKVLLLHGDSDTINMIADSMDNINPELENKILN